jgi:hypothetical protein
VIAITHCGEMKEEMKEEITECMMEWWEHLSEDKKKAIMKAKLDMNMKKVQARLDFLKECRESLDRHRFDREGPRQLWREILCSY